MPPGSIMLPRSGILPSSGMHGIIHPNMNISLHSNDIKPDISVLSNPSSTHGSYFGFPPVIGMPPYSQQSGHGGQNMTSPPIHSPNSSLGSPNLLCLSPTGTASPGMASAFNMNNKHVCAICGDRASGKHYGVYRYASFSKY